MAGQSRALGGDRILGDLDDHLLPFDGTIDWPAGKPDLGFVFQDATLMPWATALRNVLLPLEIKRLPTREAAQRAEAALESVGLAYDFRAGVTAA